MLHLHRALNPLEDQLDVERSLSQGFVRLAEQVRERVERPGAEEKHAYYAAAMAHTLTAAPSDIDLAAMLAALDDLRMPHLRMLAILRTGSMREDEFPHRDNMVRIMGPRLPGWTAEQIEAHRQELQRQAITPFFAVARRPVRGSHLALANDLTDFGFRFADWIAPPP